MGTPAEDQALRDKAAADEKKTQTQTQAEKDRAARELEQSRGSQPKPQTPGSSSQK